MRRVVKMDLDGNELKVYPTIKECSEDNKISSSVIVRCCSDNYKGNRTKEYIFQYKD